jgi:hypothetical protein
MTGIEFFSYATRFLDAAEALHRDTYKVPYDAVQLHLLCQSLELYLKAFIWLIDRHSRDKFRSKYGHDLVKLWRHSRSRGIQKYCAITPRRDEIVALVGPYYKARKFVYADISMLVDGIPRLRNNTKALTTLRRLCRRLQKTLKDPVIEAS